MADDPVTSKAQMSDEEFVRQNWIDMEHGSVKGQSGFYIWAGPTLSRIAEKATASKAWAAAAEFTRERLEQIRQIEEEIEYLNTQIAVSDYRLKQNLNDPYAAAWWSKRAGVEKSILAREQDALTELKRGMRHE